MSLETYLQESAIAINKKTTELRQLAKSKGLPFADVQHFRKEATNEYILEEIYKLKESKNVKRSSNNTRKSTSKSSK